MNKDIRRNVIPGIAVLMLLMLASSLDAYGSVVPIAAAAQSSAAQREAQAQDSEAEASDDEKRADDDSSESENGSDNPLHLELEELSAVGDITDLGIDAFTEQLKQWGLLDSVSGMILGSVIILGVMLLCYGLAFGLLYLLLSRIASAISRLTRAEARGRIRYYRKFFAVVLAAATLLLFYAALRAYWDADADVFVEDGNLRHLFDKLLQITFIGAIAFTLIEISHIAIELLFRKQAFRSTARADTLKPIILNFIYATIAILFGLTLLSEIGINIMPLLAGAGVVGFAIGFGAQTLVKDVITGMIIIIEDLMQVGDVASVGGKIGLVEKITIRKVQLRDLAGIVYTVPFSEISIVENWTKEFSYYIFDIGVAYREDVDKVMSVLKEIDEDVRADEEFNQLILEPLEIMGLDKFDDSAVVVKARIKTKPIQQWTVGREFNRRIKMAFDKYNIEIPFPHQTLYFGENHDGSAPSAKVELLDAARNKAANEDSPNTQKVEPSRGDGAKNQDNDGDIEGDE